MVCSIRFHLGYERICVKERRGVALGTFPEYRYKGFGGNRIIFLFGETDSFSHGSASGEIGVV
jgi:hypothetical protein